jgi:ferritin-like protein
MGELARKILGVDAKVVSGLLSAYADEWYAHYNYEFVALALRGHRAPSLTKVLAKRSHTAFYRTQRLGRRLLELGATPPRKMGELEKLASDKPFKLPKSLSDPDAMVRAVLDAERTSLRSYHQLHEISSKDPLTRRLAVEFLSEAVASEEDLEKLLGSSASEMTGD